MDTISRKDGAPSVDWAAFHNSRREYDKQAQPAMMAWVTGEFKRILGNHEGDATKVQYQDVMRELKKSGDLPYAHEGTFCRQLLLAGLEEAGLFDLPYLDRERPNPTILAMLAILYSIDIQGDDRLLVRLPAIVDNQNLVFEVDLEVQGMKLRKYFEVLNYLNPQQAELKWIKTEMREENAAVLGDAGQQKDRDNGLQIMPV